MPLANNQLLKYNGSKWTNSFSSLSEQSDVIITTPVLDQLLTYNGSNWINSNLSTGGRNLANGYAGLDANVRLDRNVISLTFNLGSWTPRTNTPTLTNGGDANTIDGSYYKVSETGLFLLDGCREWRQDDLVMFRNGAWRKIPTGNPIVRNTNANPGTVAFDRFLYAVELSEKANRYRATDFIPQRLVVNSSGTTYGNTDYSGAVYCAKNNCIYLIPSRRSPALTFHGINCDNDQYFTYDNGLDAAAETEYISDTGLSSTIYYSGVYSPLQNRIYLVPHNRGSSTTWHYIDCYSNTLVPYTAVALDANAYYGGVYAPLQNRIYFAPFNQRTNWHYIDCNTGNVVAYTAPANVDLNADSYRSGVYDPVNNKIYLVPYGQSNNPIYHRINVTSNTIETYNRHDATIQTYGYSGGAYSPTEFRIYFGQNELGSNYFYIDVLTETTVAFPRMDSIIDGAVHKPIYSPSLDRIIMAQLSNGHTRFIYRDPILSGNDWTRITTTGSLIAEVYSSIFCPVNNNMYGFQASYGRCTVTLFYQMEPNIVSRWSNCFINNNS